MRIRLLSLPRLGVTTADARLRRPTGADSSLTALVYCGTAGQRALPDISSTISDRLHAREAALYAAVGERQGGAGLGPPSKEAALAAVCWAQLVSRVAVYLRLAVGCS